MMSGIVDPQDSLERQNQKLIEISEALMRHVEKDNAQMGAAYAQFERAAVLEDEVRQRTRDLEQALDLLNTANADLAQAHRATEAARADLTDAIEAVQEGFALFDAAERLVMFNSRFCLPMADVREALHPGMAFDDYVVAISRSRCLDLPAGLRPRDWAGQRRAHHSDSHVMFNVTLTGDRWLQVSEHRTPNGGTVIIQTDVTDIMLFERQERGKLLDRQARLIRATLDHINQGVCIFDHEARLVGWNNQISALLQLPVSLFRTGAGFHSLFGKLRSDLIFPPEVNPQSIDLWVHQHGERAPLSFEVCSPHNVTLAVFAQEMPDRGFVISITDVSAERNAARALADANELLEQRVMARTLELEAALAAAERANASKSRFVAAASHDLLQPLSAAKLYLAALSEGQDRTQNDRAIAAKAESALVSVEQILDALLNISRLDADKAALDVTQVELTHILRALADEFAPLAAQKGLRLRVVQSRALVRSDPAFLRRILQNLISNAIRYTATGRVLLGARRDGDTLRLEVWDTGPGIPPKDQRRIFQEFQRLDAQASASEGMGLGLAIVERACARLGHALALHSAPGRGTRFSVSVPLCRAATLPMPSAGGDAPHGELAQRRLAVLLVENDPELREAMCVLLEKWGVGVLDVADGTEALTLLDELAIVPDAFLLDHRLDGGLDGLDLHRRLRRLYGDIPSRIISADRSAELRRNCARAGVTLLAKPIASETLEAFLMGLGPGAPHGAP